ncbi:MAG TPA: type I restriction-modification system subunit M [Methanothrix sp.]|nr:type I restriction-modification system subunit M [Methanothrix sp.]
MALKKSELYSSIWQACDQLRGGMDASQYKDYVLVLLFVKYVSDRYGKDPDPVIVIPKGSESGRGGSFEDMLFWKGKAEIGDQINKIIGRLAEANGLKGVIDVTDFNNTEKLGSGKAMVDRLSKLLSIFDKPELDFSKNRAEGDDLLGDAYEYLMKNFAVQSGKSKGQFYTPAEVSRVMSKVIEVSRAKSASQTVYDPTCGSGSLLIKAASEAEVELSVFGQEIDNSMSGLAKMNMILHNIPTAVIHNDNTLAAPYFKNSDGNLRGFDFAVSNPPFSEKNWRNGLTPENDEFKRFDGFGVPPAKNGDYAFLLHLIKSLKSSGKGAIILPHGVLFRGNAEAEIRKNIIKRGYIKGIIGLPANLFYGTGIPACIIVIDKEAASSRKAIFIIDAGKGYIKDGNKNRLREQDIHKIVDVFSRELELDKYSRLVPYSEIEKNDYNLNIPRYIDNSEAEELQDIEAHLRGGIPSRDVHALEDFWSVMPSLKAKLLSCFGGDGYMKLNIEPTELRKAILEDNEFAAFKRSVMSHFEAWKAKTAEFLKDIKPGDKPKLIISQISESLLASFSELPLVDKYDVYQLLMLYWEESMQDDVHALVVDGWTSDLIAPELIVQRWFRSTQDEIDKMIEQREEISQHIDEIAEEQNPEDDLLAEVKNDKGKITKALVSARSKTIKHDPDSAEEMKLLKELSSLFDQENSLKVVQKYLENTLALQLKQKITKLSHDEIKSLLVEDKWLARLQTELLDSIDLISHRFSSHLQELAERYAEPLPQIEQEVAELSKKVEEHLKKMGFSWN